MQRRIITIPELIQAFPEAEEILPTKVQEWLLEKEHLIEEVRDKIRQYKNTNDYWLVRYTISEFIIPKIKQADRHIARLKILMKAYKGKLPKDIITDEDVRQAKQYDIKWLYEEKGGKLKRIGRNYIGLCPFHEEKHPSFQIYTNSNSFYCFGCNRGGDAITFVQKIFALSFIGAVEYMVGK